MMKSCQETDKEALLKLKDSFNIDEYGSLSTWKSEVDCCQWFGVSCSNLTGHVIMLDLESADVSNKLRGNIDSSLCDLQHLTYLCIFFNNFKGLKIPECIGSLGQLRELIIVGSSIGGTIPRGLQNLSNLQTLDLSNNDLIVNDLEWISHLSSLRYLALSGINLSQAVDWASSLSKAPHLSGVDLQDCALISHVNPASFVHTNSSTSLKYLYLGNNYLDSSILPWLYNNSKDLKYLELYNNALSSETFPDFSRFSKVVILDLANTSLHGSIPQSFGHLPFLSELYLSDNNLTGPLPVFAGLESLKYLDLSNNRLKGNILPGAFRQVPNLVKLHLSSNRLNSVINDTHLSPLSNLRVLDVSQNLIFFNFSSNWVPPFQLQIFSASSCNFGPHFPKWLKYQRELQMLDISDASISDSIPHWLWLTSIQYLNLSKNKLHGELPKSFLKIHYYVWDLSFNNLSGPLPNFPPHAAALLLSNNMFSGNISFICATFQGSFLEYLDLSNNILSGKLPDCWGQLPFLEVLRLQNNHFSGSIPNSIGTLNFLQSIHLNNNNLIGNLPSLMNSSSLLFIDFGQNNLNGKLPSWVGQYLHKLIGLRLKENKLNGSIPPNLCNLSFLQILDLSKNNITGNIPHCFGNLSAMSNKTSMTQAISYRVFGNVSESSSMDTSSMDTASFMDTATLSWKGVDVEYSKILGLMKTIDLSCNHLTGEIPSGISTLVALASLNLSRNNLKGPIPFNMGQMERLESLDLSRNSLSGEIPMSFSNLSFLSVLNLSFNNLSGKIPTATQLQTFDASSYMGNRGLYGPPLTEGCLNPYNPQSIDADGDDNLISFGFYMSMALGFIVGFWGVCGTLILKRSWRHSFFRFFTNINDWIYVQVAILKAKIKRRFQN